MLAEKAALLGREVDGDDDTTIQRVRSPLAVDGDHTTQPLTTPGDVNATDPLGQPRLTPLEVQSPTNETPELDFTASARPPISEKARGKMRATSVSSIPGPVDSLENDEELMKVAEAGVGPNGYVPTQEWVTSWQKG
jgi:hypothetical protein